LGLVKAAMEVAPSPIGRGLGFRGYGLSSEQRPLTRIANAIRPLPGGSRGDVSPGWSLIAGGS